MARRSDHTRDELRKMALAAAREIVEREGASGLTARKVAGAIGYSPGTLYNLFDGLDDLVWHLNAATLEGLEGVLSQAARRHAEDGVEDRVMGLVDAYMGYVRERASLWRLIFDYNAGGDGSLPEWYQEVIDRLLGELEQAIAPLFPEGCERSRREAGRVLWCGMHGIVSLSWRGKLGAVSDRAPREMVLSLVTHYLNGLRADAEKAA